MVLEQLVFWFSVWSSELISTWGYLGLFIVNIAGNASVIFPLPAYMIVMASGAFLNPWLVGIVAGFGAAIGELVAYGVGAGGGRLLKKKYKKLLCKSASWAEKHGIFPLLILFAVTPLPDDVIGLLAGAIRYNIKKFFVATLAGKIIAHITLAWAGFFGSYFLGGWNFLIVLVISFLFVLVMHKLVYRSIAEMKYQPRKLKRTKKPPKGKQKNKAKEV